ncbi:MAG: ATP-binding protein [Gammaproteobacteria bacterium]|nr:ATP-binding protein [Gammaproteobacteria bacterium]
MSSQSSIRTFLIINLLLGVVVIASLTIAASAFFNYRWLRSYLDTELMLSAENAEVLVSTNFKATNFDKTQAKINQLAANFQNYNSQKNSLSKDLPRLVFQIFDNQGRLVLHTPGFTENLEHYPIKAGFNYIVADGKKWRVFATKNDGSGHVIVVAERLGSNSFVVSRITGEFIFMAGMTLLIGIFIWVVVGRGLAGVNRITNEIKNRDRTNLRPVDLENAPIEIKPVLQELNKLFSRLRETFFREKRFSADAAHELRTPLAALLVQAHVALNSKNDEERRIALLSVIKGVERSSRIVQQLLTLSRATTDTADFYKNKVAINREAARVIAELVPLAQKKNITLELIAKDAPQIIIGNETMTGVLIKNLVDNAIRYIPNNSTVQVIIDENEKNIFLHVIDNGPGIPVELREKVFEHFYRIPGTEPSGSGLGLSIVKRIVQASDASVKLQTPETGNGLEVIVTFPKPNLK